jgi:hypothetical protein
MACVSPVEEAPVEAADAGCTSEWELGLAEPPHPSALRTQRLATTKAPILNFTMTPSATAGGSLKEKLQFGYSRYSRP